MSDSMNPDDLAAESVRIAARAYDEALGNAEDALRLLRDAREVAPPGEPDDARDRLTTLSDAADYLADCAAETLSYAVQLLAPGETVERLNHLGYDWPVRAASWQGKTYVSWIGETEDGGRPGLLVMDAAAVVEIVGE